MFSKELSDSGISFNEIVEDILVIENFISQNEIDEFFDFINNSKEEDWSTFYLSNLKKFAMLKHGRDDLENLVAEGKLEITENWADKNLLVSDRDVAKNFFDRLQKIVLSADENLILTGCDTLQRMYSGVKLHPHTDQDTDPSITYASILYLNDDYADGELFFDNINLTLKPRPGTLILFPGTEKFHHGVKPVGEGPVRYVVVGFIKIKDFYENNKY